MTERDDLTTERDNAAKRIAAIDAELLQMSLPGGWTNTSIKPTPRKSVLALPEGWDRYQLSSRASVILVYWDGAAWRQPGSMSPSVIAWREIPAEWLNKANPQRGTAAGER